MRRGQKDVTAGKRKSGDENKSKKFAPYMKRKLAFLFFALLLILGGLGVRLFFITRDNGEEYKKQVLTQQKYNNTTIPYKRGEIVDSKGTKLAVSEKIYSLVLDAKEILSDEKYLEPTLRALTEQFSVDTAKLRQYIKDNPSSQYYVAMKGLSLEQKEAFEELAAVKDNNIAGVWFEGSYKRVYPNNDLACNVIGFLDNEQEGKYGLEEYYDDVLQGIDGREYGYLDDNGNLAGTTKAAVDGYNIHTTIDATIQGIVEKYLEEFNEQYKNAYREGNGAYNVGAIVMDVNTGEVLAMAQYPSFDLNNPYSTEPLVGMERLDVSENTVEGKTQLKVTHSKEAITEETAAAIEGTQLNQNLSALYKNFAIASTYEPGSTMKPFVVAAGLESGKMSTASSFECRGYLEIGGYTIKCHNYRMGGDGILTVGQSVERSCNVALMEMGQVMGKTTLLEYLQNFNFGLKTNIDLAGESRTVDLVFNENTMGPTELATSTFGQGFNVSMIQMITGFSALVNGGYYYEPHVVNKITASDGSVVQNIEPRLLKQVISQDTSANIREYCEEVVYGAHGTGSTASPAGYRIGGKTGTAEMAGRDKINYVVSFMGYAPADDPEIAVYVVVDRPNTQYQDDAKFATRIVRKIFTEVLPYLNIFMTEEITEAERAELEALQIDIKEKLTGDVSENDVEPEEEISPEEIAVAEENAHWNPTTGYRLDENGVLIDVATGEAVDLNSGSGLPDSPILDDDDTTEE